MTELRDKLQPEDPNGPAEAGREDPNASAAATGSTGGRGGSREADAGSGPMHSDAENFGLKGFSTWESHLATRLGVTRRELTALRSAHLQEGADFLKMGRRVVYCDLGVTKLARVLSNGQETEKSLPTGVLCAPEPEKNVSRFTVRRKALNTRVLECTDEGGRIVVVRVARSDNFVPGMAVEAVPYGELPNVFEFVGPYPRFRGKY